MTSAETISRKRVLIPNHSTSELIPKNRSDKLKMKREQLRRKLNRVAAQIYDLKYDTEYDSQELRLLTKKGEELFQRVQEYREIVEENRERVRDVTGQVTELNVEMLVLDLDHIHKPDGSERSTVSSVTDRQWKEEDQRPKTVETERILSRRVETRPKTTESGQVLRTYSSVIITRNEQSKKRNKQNYSAFDVWIGILSLIILLSLI